MSRIIKCMEFLSNFFSSISKKSSLGITENMKFSMDFHQLASFQPGRIGKNYKEKMIVLISEIYDYNSCITKRLTLYCCRVHKKPRELNDIKLKLKSHYVHLYIYI